MINKFLEQIQILFTKILMRLINIEILINKVNKYKIIQCRKLVTIRDNSSFFEQAHVSNLQKDNTKIRIGEHSHIRGELTIFPYGGEIIIGNGCYIGENSKLWSGEMIILGNYVGIAHNVNIVDFNHETNHLERAEGVMNIFLKGHPSEKGNIITAPIIIEDYVAIYPNSSILRGVTIGKGAIISTGSVVLNDVAPFSIVMGNPARVMGKVS